MQNKYVIFLLKTIAKLAIIVCACSTVYHLVTNTIQSLLGLFLFIVAISLFFIGIGAVFAITGKEAFISSASTEELQGYLIKKTPVYGIGICIGTLILFFFLGTTTSLSFLIFTGILFATPIYSRSKKDSTK